jgi:DNA-3-methyladenine glycosylase II
MKLKMCPPYDFALSTDIYIRLVYQVVDYYEEGVHRRVYEHDGDLVLIETAPSGTVDGPSLEMRLLYPKVGDSSEILAGVADEVGWMFGADDDLSALYGMMDEEPETRGVKSELYGLKPPRVMDLYECIVGSIIEQSISLAAAFSVRKRLVERYGRSVGYGGRDYFTFPKAEILAAVSEDDLFSVGLSRGKTRAIKTVSELVARGDLDLDSLRDLSTAEFMRELTTIKGIGPWTAEVVASRAMGRYDVVLDKDVGLRAGLKKWYGAERVQSADEIRGILGRFGAWSGYVAYYFMYSYAYDRYKRR